MSKLKQSGKCKTLARQAKGITLVALIITIIVLLILAMVSIRLVMNGGIIDRAERGTQAYSDAEIEEQIKLAYAEWQTAQFTGETRTAEQFITARLQSTFGQTNGESNVKNVSVTNGKVIAEIRTTGEFVKYSYDAGTGVASVVEEWKQNQDGSYSKGSTSGVQVGDIVKYETKLTANAVDGDKKSSLISDLGTYSGNTDSSKNTDSSVVRDSLTWKVLDVKDGKIRLISAVPTTSKIGLYNADGYNNAVYLLDKACDTLYSVDGVGKAQNLKIEDIEEKLSNTGKNKRDNYANSNVDTGKYGGTKEYTSTLQYPNIYQSEVGCKAVATADNTGNTLGLSEQTSLVTGKPTVTNRLKVTQTYWGDSMASTDFTDSKYYTLFKNNGSDLATYWLSSRCVHCSSSGASFSVRRVGYGSVGDCNMFYSYGNANGNTYAFRPVVSLESNIQLSGDSTNGWTIQ